LIPRRAVWVAPRCPAVSRKSARDPGGQNCSIRRQPGLKNYTNRHTKGISEGITKPKSQLRVHAENEKTSVKTEVSEVGLKGFEPSTSASRIQVFEPRFSTFSTGNSRIMPSFHVIFNGRFRYRFTDEFPFLRELSGTIPDNYSPRRHGYQPISSRA